jgi:hypothetical protein
MEASTGPRMNRNEGMRGMYPVRPASDAALVAALVPDVTELVARVQPRAIS